ncbi:MAG: 3-hydroxyacyl-CoA dehydrogenase family protein [Chitinophagales bacterium]
MKILILGEKKRADEFRTRLDHEMIFDNSALDHPEKFSSFDMITDLNADERNELPDYFSLPESKLLILSAVKKSLSSMVDDLKPEVLCAVAGINALPTFINRNKIEVSFFREEDRDHFEKFATEMKLDFLEVSDRTGMVTPRVICMIINEACFTFQEGTASKEDIDKAMKLGTNYPFGPFEWCDRIGIKDVYETLDAIWNDTHDPRYKICPLLKTKYLQRESFYS